MEIHWHHMGELSSDKHFEIEERLLQLAEEHDDIIDVRIAGREDGHQRRGARRARISCQVRGKKIVAVRQAASLGMAAAGVLDAFERELRKLRSRRHDERDRLRLAPRRPLLDARDSSFATASAAS